MRRSKKNTLFAKNRMGKMKVTREAGKSFSLTIIQASFKFSTATCYFPPATDVSASTKVFCIFSQDVPSVTGE